MGFFLFFMVWQPIPAYAAQASAYVTCQNSVGETREFGIGWNNENDYFLDKGNIPQHFCEGGFAGEFTTFVSVVSFDRSELDSTLLYHPNYSPSPSPEPVPSPEPSPEVSPTPEVVEPSPEPTVEPTPEPTPEVEPSPEPTPEPSPEVTEEPAPQPMPEPVVEPSPEPEPTLISPVTPVQPIEPEISPSPIPSPENTPTAVVEPEVEQTLIENIAQLPQLALEQVAKLVDNLRSIGSDMSPEVREQSQQVIVASVIVTQVALAGRKF